MPPTCHLCNEPTTDDNLCYGCGVHICDSHPSNPWGKHEPEDHDDDPDDVDAG